MDILFGILFRHALTAAGAYLVAKGYADASAVDGVMGAVSTLAGFGMSVFNKKRLGAL